MDLQLKGRLALVSASTAGIGYGIAEMLGREGARVIVNGRTQAAVDAALERLRAASGGDFVGFAGDLSQAAPCEALAAAHPGVEILVNNLGVYHRVDFEDATDADWQRSFDTNVFSGIRLSRLYLPAMRRANWGRIIFISSESGMQIPADSVLYGMTKAAQIAIARGLAETVAGTGITVNSVLPGPTLSRGVEMMFERGVAGGATREAVEAEFFQTGRPTSLIRRFASLAEVASLVAYVASPLASATTGAALRVDGGTVKSAF